MRDESHLDDMRAAIRGDFDRLAERRGGQELMRAPPEDPEPTVDSAHHAEPEPEPDLPAEPEPAEEPQPTDEQLPVADEPVVEEPPKRSWLARLLGV